MSRVVVLGSGIAGHTAAAFARRWLGKNDTVTVVSPRDHYNWVPSNIWVGVGQMDERQVVFPLAPVYKRKGIEFHQALATEIHGDGDTSDPAPFVTVRYTDPQRQGQVATLKYDYLINDTATVARRAELRAKRRWTEPPTVSR